MGSAGQAGADGFGHGGAGEVLSGTLPNVHPGELLDVCVDFGGGAGGAGATALYAGGAGGGASGVAVGSDFSNPALIASGGGGGGMDSGQGGDAGATKGGDGGSGFPATGGFGATRLTFGGGGAAGFDATATGGGDGAQFSSAGPGQGGAGGSDSATAPAPGDGGGGGGGGYFGGGGGGGAAEQNAGGGGGGTDICGVLAVGCAVGTPTETFGDASVTLSYTVDDTVAPSISVSHTADASNGWNTSSPVTVTVTASDSGSGLAGDPTCTVDGDSAALTPAGSGTWTFQVSGDGTHSVACSVSDNAGNPNSAGDTVKVDTTKPSISISHAADGQNGWNVSSPVTETATASDSGSGLGGDPTCTVDGSGATLTPTGSGSWTFPVSGDGVHAVSCSVSDNAGNGNSAGDTVKIDTTKPTLNPSVSPSQIVLFDAGSASPSASDATSNVSSSSCGPLDTSTPGVYTVTCTATDNAGNTATQTAQYTVILPPSTKGCLVEGAGAIVAANGDWAFWGMDVSVPLGSSAEQEHGLASYTDLGPAQRFALGSHGVQAVNCTLGQPNSGSLFGSETLAAGQTVYFRIDATASSRIGHEQVPANPGSYRIRLSSGYDSGSQPVADGEIQIEIGHSSNNHG